MIQVDIPGKECLKIRHVIFDYNGTIGKDGKLIQGVKQGIRQFSDRLTFHVLTADTFGSAKKQLQGVNALLTVISKDNQHQKKLDYLDALGAEQTLCAGNGRNDVLMLKKACIGIAVLGDEGVSSACLSASDIVVKDILDVFGLLKTPERIIATLRL
ncbi:MAG: ATPase P [Desulfobacterales bacterium]|nr:ATPase P [Desulfobacterales bacterium]